LDVDLVEKMRLLHIEIQINVMVWRTHTSGFTPKNLRAIHAN
jgi:hypothetical protein